MRLYAVQTADTGDLAAPRDAAREARAAAMARRRALAAGRSALVPAHERVPSGFSDAELRTPAVAAVATPPVAPDGQGARRGGRGAPGGRAGATDGVGAAQIGRALSVQRRRQLSRGKQALNGAVDRTATAAGAGAPTFIVLRGGAR